MPGGAIPNVGDLLPQSWADKCDATIPTGSEDRRHPRFYFRTLATATIYPPTGQEEKGPHTCYVLTRDLSRGGISILHPVPLFQSQRVDLEFPTGQKLSVEIKWIRRLEQNCFVLGCRIRVMGD
jgi:hypothetical protein